MKKINTNNSMTLMQMMQEDTSEEVHALAMKGVQVAMFTTISIQYHLDENELAAIIGLPLSTLHYYKEQKKLIVGRPAEHLLKLANLFAIGIIIFRNATEFNKWLLHPFKLSKVIAKDYLQTISGINILIEELHAIGVGYPV